jgi:hypothetical protein
MTQYARVLDNFPLGVPESEVTQTEVALRGQRVIVHCDGPLLKGNVVVEVQDPLTGEDVIGVLLEEEVAYE